MRNKSLCLPNLKSITVLIYDSSAVNSLGHPITHYNKQQNIIYSI